MTPAPPTYELGLALSGGTAKSVAHIGVLKAFEREGLVPDILAGTSGGSLIASVYASGMDIESMVEMARTINWRRLARVRIPRLGLFSNQGVADLIRDTVGDLQFEDLEIPTYVVTTDLLSGKKKVFSRGPVAPAVRASCSIPQIFSPVEIDGGLYADGGFVEYLPVETLLELNCRWNVGVNLGAYADFSKPPTHLLGMIMRTIGIVSVRSAAVSAPKADLVIEPPLKGFTSFDLGRADELVELGYESACRAIEELRARMAQAPTPPWWRRLLGLGSSPLIG